MQKHLTRAWVEVDLGALVRNGAALAAQAGVPLLPMLKADAYGTGAVRAALALERLSPWGYGVATIAEGAELRRAGIERPVVVFTPLDPADFRAAREAALTPVFGRAADIMRWRSTGGGPWHLGVDTGMSRAGVRWDAAAELRDALLASPPDAAFTHFHSAELGDGSMEEQERRFRLALAEMPARPPRLSTENSAAIARRRRSEWDLVRPGVFLYGVGSGAGALITPEPVVSLRACVVDMRTIPTGASVSYDATYVARAPRRVATLAVGYADGYPRGMSGRGAAIVRGRIVPVLGVVTMDMTMIDVSDVPCELGDVATLIGRDGDELLDVERVAALGGAHPYELLTGLGVPRLPHVYGEVDS
jgi:alanine racemase